jgi:hypothetical protein
MIAPSPNSLSPLPRLRREEGPSWCIEGGSAKGGWIHNNYRPLSFIPSVWLIQRSPSFLRSNVDPVPPTLMGNSYTTDALCCSCMSVRSGCGSARRITVRLNTITKRKRSCRRNPRRMFERSLCLQFAHSTALVVTDSGLQNVVV